ncbi:chitin binding Peritrophin-A domain protein [Ostertagia ostertagi]
MWLLCPFDLIFDGSIEECKDQRSVAECGSMSSDRSSHVQDTKGLPNSLCEGSEDGYHSATECSNSVVECVGGVSSYGDEAPGGLSHEASTSYEASGESSGDISGNLGQDAAANPAYQAPEGAAQNEQSESTTAVSETVRAFCEGKMDGFYAHGCSSEVIACRGGEAKSMLCPSHMLYDEQKRKRVQPRDRLQVADVAEFSLTVWKAR